MELRETLRMDKSHFSVVSLDEPSDERSYWLEKTPHQRLEALELLRQVMYGYNPATTRLQRILTVIERSSS
jgi:hypothetical protein